MQKIQILFPAPDMQRLREAARQEDRPISELVRRATEAWLACRATAYRPHEQRDLPLFRGGKPRVPGRALRQAAWSDRLAALTPAKSAPGTGT